MIRTSSVVLIATVFLTLPRPAGAAQSSKFIRAIDRMMVALGPESARDAPAIREAYQGHLDLLVLHQYDELEGALFSGGFARRNRCRRPGLAARRSCHSSRCSPARLEPSG